MQSNPLKAHIPALDGVRGVAILLVLVVHFCQLFLEKSHTVLWKMSLAGQTGVDLFFVLSGFLITGILLDSKGTPHVIRNFYVRRMLRIVPLYYLTLAGIYLVWPVLHWSAWVPWSQNFWYWTYLQDIPWAFNNALQSGPNHFWSLAVEQHYYILWPFFVLRFGNRRLLQIIAAAVGISLLSRVIWSQHEMYYFTLARLDSLSLGAAIAILARTQNAPGLAKMVPWAKRTLLAVALTAGALALLPASFVPLTHVLRNTLIAFFYAALIVLVLENQCGPIGKLLAAPALRSVGRYSYAMYLFHPFLFGWLLSLGLLHYNLWSLVLGSVMTYVVGWISWQVIEKPILGLKRHFEYREVKTVRIELHVSPNFVPGQQVVE